MYVIIFILCVTLISLTYGFINPYPTLHTLNYEPGGHNVGSPLFLTPLIEAGQIDVAKNEARVEPLKGDLKSYAGFLTVKNTSLVASHMYFWVFPALKNNLTAPVILWLQGGPGATSLFGLFEEHGPFYVKKKGGLKLRKYFWAQSATVIYMDNPVGTGFSFTTNDKGYARTENDVGDNLYKALIQFFTLFPEWQKNDFYVTGESYAGKYVPALSWTIDRKNPQSKLKINLKGMAIGNGLCDPLNMMGYSDYLYQIGLIDSNGWDSFQKQEQLIRQLIQHRQWDDAFNAFDQLLSGDLTKGKSLFHNLTQFDDYFNYLHFQDDSPYGNLDAYVQKPLVRLAIHVGNSTFQTDTKVEQYLKQDFMQSAAPYLKTLVEKYKVLFYNGQLDIIVAYPLTVNFLRTLPWSGLAEYKTAERKPWFVGGQLAGFVKTVKNLQEVLVRNAGHMVPFNQPLFALDLITRFTNNLPFPNSSYIHNYIPF